MDRCVCSVFVLLIAGIVLYFTKLHLGFDVAEIRRSAQKQVSEEFSEAKVQFQIELEHLRSRVDSLQAENKRLHEIRGDPEGRNATALSGLLEHGRAPETALAPSLPIYHRWHDVTNESNDISEFASPPAPESQPGEQKQPVAPMMPAARSNSTRSEVKRRLSDCTADDANWQDQNNVNCKGWIFNRCNMFLSVSGSCTIDSEHDCIKSPHYPGQYDESDCTITIDEMNKRPFTRVGANFHTANNFDYIRIDGNDYSGNLGSEYSPGSSEDIFGITPTGLITWTTDQYTSATGWHLCAQNTKPKLVLVENSGTNSGPPACVLTDNDMCATSLNYPSDYSGNNDKCAIDIVGHHNLVLHDFGACSICDLKINGVEYNGNSPPPSLPHSIANAHGRITWEAYTSWSIAKGWRLCISESTADRGFSRWGACGQSCGRCLDKDTLGEACTDDTHFASECQFFAGNCEDQSHVTARISAWNTAHSTSFTYNTDFRERLKGHCPFSCQICTRCAVGRYRDRHVVYTDTVNSCKTCIAGRFTTAEHQDMCLECEWGTYNTAAQSTACTDCAVGKYAEAPGATVCLPCPPGRAGNIVRARGILTCERCQPGRYSSQLDGNTECNICSAGSYQNEVGGTGCYQCAPGMYMSDPGSTECKRCASGNYTEEHGALQCRMCPQGFTSEPGSFKIAECKCAEGKFKLGEACVECRQGFSCPGGFSYNSTGDDTTVDLMEGYMSLNTDPLNAFVCQGRRKVCPGLRKPFLNMNGTDIVPWDQVCPTGRISQSCAWCPDDWYKTENGCNECGAGDLPGMIMAVPCGVALLCLLHVWWNRTIVKERVDLKALVVCGNLYFLYCQILGVFESVAINWKPPFSDFLWFASYMRMRLDFLKVSCGIRVSPTREYMMRALVPLLGMCSLYMVYAVVWCIRRLTKVEFPPWANVFVKGVYYVNTTGSIYMLFSSGMALTAFLPFQCNTNPNGMLTNNEWPLVTCSIEDEDWVSMVTFSVVAIAIYVLLFPGIGLIQVARHQSAPMTDHYFFLKYKFLFANFEAHARFFAVVIMARNIGVAATSAFLQTDTFFQVTAMMSVMIGYLAVECMWWPWSHRFLNYIDAVGSFSLFVIMAIGAGFIEGEVQTQSLENLLLLIMIVLGSCFFIFTSYFAISHLIGRADYIIFLSHAKANGGSVARLFKIMLGHELKTTDIFLDSDNLLTLNDLAAAVQHTKNIVLLLTPGCYAREWVAVELVTTYLHKIHATMCSIDGTPPPDAEFEEQVESVFSKSLEATFPSLGIDVETIAASIHMWRTQVNLVQFNTHLSGRMHEMQMRALIEELHLSSAMRCHSRIIHLFSANGLKALGVKTMSIVGANQMQKLNDDQEKVSIDMEETVCAHICREPGLDTQMEGSILVLRQLLMAKLSSSLMLPAQKAEISQITGEIKKLKPNSLFLVCLTQNVFRSRRAVQEIVTAVLHDLFIVPVNIDWRFEYPTDGFFTALKSGEIIDLSDGEKADVGRYRLAGFAELIRTMFREIAISLNANGNDESIKQAIVAIERRYNENKLAANSVGKVKSRLSEEILFQLESIAGSEKFEKGMGNRGSDKAVLGKEISQSLLPGIDLKKGVSARKKGPSPREGRSSAGKPAPKRGARDVVEGETVSSPASPSPRTKIMTYETSPSRAAEAPTMVNTRSLNSRPVRAGPKRGDRQLGSEAQKNPTLEAKYSEPGLRLRQQGTSGDVSRSPVVPMRQPAPKRGARNTANEDEAARKIQTAYRTKTQSTADLGRKPGGVRNGTPYDDEEKMNEAASKIQKVYRRRSSYSDIDDEPREKSQSGRLIKKKGRSSGKPGRTRSVEQSGVSPNGAIPYEDTRSAQTMQTRPKKRY